MIQIVEGRGVGAGKSYYVVTRIIAHLCSGGTVFYSDTLRLLPEKIVALCEKRHRLCVQVDQLQAVSRDDVWRVHEVTPAGTDECPVLIVLDEVQRALNARDWGDKSKRALFDWACESRHDSNDLIFISQNALNIDKQVARLATYVTRVRNMTSFKIAGVKWPFRQFMINLFDGDGKTLMEKKLIGQDPEIFGCYVSKSMSGAHKRLMGVVQKRKLDKVKGGNRMKFMLVFLVVAVVVGVCLFSKAVGAGGFSCIGVGKPGASVTAPAAGKEKAVKEKAVEKVSVKPNYTVRKEVFRGASGGVLRTDVWQYEAGQMSPAGLCEAINGHVARLRTPEGMVVYVVAGDPPVRPVQAVDRPVVSGSGERVVATVLPDASKPARKTAEMPGQAPFGGWQADADAITAEGSGSVAKGDIVDSKAMARRRLLR